MRVPQSNAGEISDGYKNRATVVMSMLENHSKVFTASETGRSLLNQIMAEITSGQVAVGILNDALNSSGPHVAGSNPETGIIKTIVGQGMGKTTGKLLEDPGKCAGTMMQPEGFH